MKQSLKYSADLAGVEVGETAISDVRGDLGELTYRGVPIENLAGQPFWRVAWLVLFGNFPSVEQEKQLREFMALNSRLDKNEIAMLSQLPADLHPMLMLQGMVPLLNLQAKSELLGVSSAARDGLIIAAKLPNLIACWRQRELGVSLLTTNAEAGLHEQFLMLFNGKAPSPKQLAMLDTTQILQMEHSFNAGTFAGRVCASTLAPIQSSIAASIGTLFGVLHGGADQAALEMAMTIGDSSNAPAYVEHCLARKEKIMGMGHREYSVLDPRAKILKPMARELCDEGEPKKLFDTLCAVEETCQREFRKNGKEIRANVEFYKGAVFHQLGIPPKYFTALFAMARVYGYIAHYLEFSENSKLIRPRARYVGA